MASNCHIGSLFFISGSKVAAVFPRGLFDEKSNISPPLIWLRVPMAKFVFVCVCIVFYLCISCLSMCNCICIWSVFVWFHHQASPAAHSPPLLTSRHLPANASAVRWQFAAPFINQLKPAWRYFRAYLRILTPFFPISATNARQFFKSWTSPPPCQGIVVLFQVLTSLSGSEIWHCSTPATAVTLVFEWMMLESWEKLISENTTLAVAPLSWSNSQWYHGTIIELK